MILVLTHRRSRLSFRGWTALLLLAASLAACSSTPAAPEAGSGGSLVVPAGAGIVHPTPAPPPSSECTDSLAPPAVMPTPGAMPAGSWMAKIQARGMLIAGVDLNKYLWGYRDPVSGQVSGFDIDMLHQISMAIFGSPDRIEYKAIPTADRQQAVMDGTVDIVAQTMTITCERAKSIDFSSVYFNAGQEILVPSDSTIKSYADLAGKRVCAASANSTSLMTLAGFKLSPAPQFWAGGSDTNCLVMLQQGQVDAISTDNVILQGLHAQDANTKIVGPAFSVEPYGLAISKAHPEFTRFVNGVLANERSNGTWAAIYQRWLAPYSSDPTPTPPVATYRADS